MGGIFIALLLWAQAGDPARGLLEKAYDALRARDYDQAIALFVQARELAPALASLRKDLAYTYLKAGETELGRDEFGAALKLDPKDERIALEYGFLCYETRRRSEARRVFDRIRKSADPELRATAERAFENVDRPLAEAIARWSAVVANSPDNFSAHEELARAAEERDDFKLAAAHYREAVRLKPENRSLLLDLGRVLEAAGKKAEAEAVFEEAARTGEPRTAEKARSLLPPENTPEPVLAAPSRTAAPSPKEMAAKSYQAGYLKDALRYYEAAHEADPVDGGVMLGLGRTLNLLHRDREAAQWFALARKSPDPRASEEADRAYRRLSESLKMVHTTVWAFPFFSSRWHDVFSYGQIKTEIRTGRLPFRPYLSTRFIGDTRRTTGEAFPQYLSESSFLVGAGIATGTWKGITGWGEAASAVSYLAGRRRMAPDYRGGLAFARGFGARIGGEKPGAFAEIQADGVFVSRFGNDVLLYNHTRIGYTLPKRAGLAWQAYWNLNFTADSKREYWANFAESGPGLRFHPDPLPKSLTFSIDILRGVYTRNHGNPRGPNFIDVRAGFWYAFTR